MAKVMIGIALLILLFAVAVFWLAGALTRNARRGRGGDSGHSGSGNDSGGWYGDTSYNGSDSGGSDSGGSDGGGGGGDGGGGD